MFFCGGGGVGAIFERFFFNRHYIMREACNSLATDKPLALGFPIELESRSVDFCGGRKTGEPGEKPSKQGREPTTNSTHIWYWAGIEPGSHWWWASTLTTAPSLLP